MRVGLALVAVSLLSCAGARHNFQSSDQWAAVVLSKLCESYGKEFRESKVVAVVDQTQPVFDFAALSYVSGVDVTPESARRAQELAEQARSQFVAEPILVPESACRFQRVPKQSRYRDVIQVEMSGLVVNPFDKSFGSFVRSSAGGRPGATWIWVALVRSRTQQWSVSKILVLPTQDG
jgi:hypothetical protein